MPERQSWSSGPGDGGSASKLNCRGTGGNEQAVETVCAGTCGELPVPESTGLPDSLRLSKPRRTGAELSRSEKQGRLARGVAGDDRHDAIGAIGGKHTGFGKLVWLGVKETEAAAEQVRLDGACRQSTMNLHFRGDRCWQRQRLTDIDHNDIRAEQTPVAARSRHQGMGMAAFSGRTEDHHLQGPALRTGCVLRFADVGAGGQKGDTIGSAEQLQPTQSGLLIQHRVCTRGCQKGAMDALQHRCKPAPPLATIRKWQLVKIHNNPAAVEPPTQHLQQEAATETTSAVGQWREFKQDRRTRRAASMRLPGAELSHNPLAQQLSCDHAAMIGKATTGGGCVRGEDQHARSAC